jgi:hypothetical protein
VLDNFNNDLLSRLILEKMNKTIKLKNKGSTKYKKRAKKNSKKECTSKKSIKRKKCEIEKGIEKRPKFFSYVLA